MDATLISIFTSIIIAASIRFAVKLLNWVWLRPKNLEKCLRNQGINGNPYKIFIGDMKELIRFMKETQPKSIKISDDMAPHISHYYYQSIHKFGKNSFIWFGPSPRLNITDPELIKEILSKPDVFRKPVPDLGSIIVGGLLFLEGEKWAKHRKIVTPAFHLHKLKNTLAAIRMSCSSMMHKWEAMVCSSERSCEIDVWPYLQDLSGDMISRTAFGSRHEEGVRIFQLQKEQVKLALQIMQLSFIPGWRFFPTKANRRFKAISKEIHSLLKGIVTKREKAMERGETVGDDLLGLLMKSNLQEIQEHGNKNMGMSNEDVIEECKLFYFAGSETTSNLLVWTMVLLSQHQEWQARAREEVFQIFGTEEPTSEGLNHLKIATMILQEVLRLYTPAPLMVRTATESVKLENMTLPAGVQMSLLIGQLHHDPKIWGDDSKEFKPERFSQGISVKFLNWVWLRPKKLEKCLRKQGFNGNPYRFFIGDMKDFITAMKEERPRSVELCDDISSHILPFYHQIIKKFGKNSFVWFGPSPRLNVTDPELMKEILTKPELFQKPHPDPIRDTIVGGLLFLENEKWTKHRKIINPAFHLEKLKDMVSEISLSCSNMIDKWETLVSRTEGSFELDVWPYIEDLTGDVISRTAFGCNFEDGRRIFELQKEEVELVLQLLQFSFIPGWRYLPIKANRRVKAISQEIRALLRGIVNKREKAMEIGEAIADDLLGILMESNFKEIQEHGNKSGGMSIEEVIEECKLFYFAGSETTSNVLVWTMVLLSKHQEWQVRARDEVLQVFGMKTPTFDGLNHLKTVTMILQEVLRLYPPAPVIIRAPTRPVKLGNTTLPVGVQLTLLIGLLHYDPKIWGNDVKEFKPQRFSEGIFNATKAQFCFLPFSAGPRVCIGQNFAMIEAKMALSMILQKFSFELAPSYVHAPFPVMTLQPQLGASIILQKL